MKTSSERFTPDIEPDVELQDEAPAKPAWDVRDGARGPEDDFFCLRFRVWYPSFDCAVRTRFDTCPSCRSCEQGRFNLKRHAATIARLRRRLHHPC